MTQQSWLCIGNEGGFGNTGKPARGLQLRECEKSPPVAHRSSRAPNRRWSAWRASTVTWRQHTVNWVSLDDRWRGRDISLWLSRGANKPAPYTNSPTAIFGRTQHSLIYLHRAHTSLRKEGLIIFLLYSWVVLYVYELMDTHMYPAMCVCVVPYNRHQCYFQM